MGNHPGVRVVSGIRIVRVVRPGETNESTYNSRISFVFQNKRFNLSSNPRPLVSKFEKRVIAQLEPLPND